jgi:hypothetical protein
LHALNAMLYVAEQGRKWRGLPKRCGNWHIIYTRMDRWSKNGVLDRVFEQLQRGQIVRIKIPAEKLLNLPENFVSNLGGGTRQVFAGRREESFFAKFVLGGVRLLHHNFGI